MNNRLSITSRILVAFASGALVAVFFMPAWRIDLFAPQYPEGLTLNIWINGLSGEIDVINGLNHYIGMQHIKESMFPEFKFLPFVVGFYMLFGMAVAITGNRKLLLIYLLLCVIGGALAMYDFYQWGYDYGHNLDPNAAIQVPGLSYQPPLFGHKRLLNFDAYSYPDVGGWIVICASALAFGVYGVEWFKHRRSASNVKAAVLVSVLLSIGFFSCNAQPEPFKYGKEDCHYCKMTIMDPKFGYQLITKKGKISKFDDVNCLNGFLKSNKLDSNTIKQIVATNFNKENDLVDINKSVFVIADAIKSPMNSHTAAFDNRESALKFSQASGGKIYTWKELQAQLQ